MGRKKVSAKVKAKILSSIMSGEYEPGSKLPCERHFSSKFNASRSAVRTALKDLQEVGKVKLVPRKGAYVLEDTGQSLKSFPEVGEFELSQAQFFFASEVAALAAPLMTEEIIGQLEGYISIMSGQLCCGMTPEEANSAFHIGIACATANKAIVFVINTLWKIQNTSDVLESLYHELYKVDLGQRITENKAILAALKLRNSEAARNAMRKHYARVTTSLLDQFEANARREVKKKIMKNRSRFEMSEALT